MRNPAHTHIRTACGGNQAVFSPLSPLAVPLYLASGTASGITTNGVWSYGMLDYPIILDLLEAAGVTWKVYNVNFDSVPCGNTDNAFVFWKW